MELTHASFFSGVGGLDRGIEQAGWRTVSFSEIDPYASAVLAERWPGVPNLGDIVAIADAQGDGRRGSSGRSADRWHTATLWSGGFPCQDLSVAGKRAGMGTADDRTRSGLAHAFLDLVERHRPPAILLENVPGLLSSNKGRDFGALLDRLGQLGYWWAYRILDAQFFGVPQRRRRVFICALHAGAGFGADSAAAVLSVGSRCNGHSAAGDEAGEGAASSSVPGVDHVGSLNNLGHHGWTANAQSVAQGHVGIYNATAKFGEFVADDVAGNLSARDYKSSNHLVSPVTNPQRQPGDQQGGGHAGVHSDHLVSPAPDPGGVREADGLAGRLDDRPLAFRKAARVSDPGSPETWVDDGLANTLNSFDVGDIRTTHIALDPTSERDASGLEPDADSLLPLGLDSHRYRCCGNGVVSNVSEWIGLRLRWAMESEAAA